MSASQYTHSILEQIRQDARVKNGVYAYLSASANTTTTLADTWYPLQGTFVNDFDNFELDTDKIKYIGTNDYEFEIDWHCTMSSDTNGTTPYVTIKKNSTEYDAQKMGTYLKTANEPMSFSGTAKVMLSTDDTVQLIVESDKAGAVLTTCNFTTTIKQFYISRG